MTVNIITIGDEILIGQTIDTNSAWLGQQLSLTGASVTDIHSIQDEHNAIKNAIQSGFHRADLVLMTGGLGPTKDDVTKEAIADYFGVKLVLHAPTWKRIQAIFAKRGRKTTAAHYQQCFLPENAQLLENAMGTAPGMWFEKDGKVLVSMPGVPYEMKYLVQTHIIPRLADYFVMHPVAHRTILTAGAGESQIAERVADFEDSLPTNIRLAFLPNPGQVRLRLSGHGDNQMILDELIDQKADELSALLSDLVFGKEEMTLSAAIGELLKKRNLTFATAESCTGGFIAHQITAISGSSAYFLGSVVSYDNKVKESVLKVRTETLKNHGAVSQQTVIEMAKGVLEVIPADISVAVSGIAGPGGGTPQKPVGTIWLAVSNHEQVETLLLKASKNRLLNIEYATINALNLVRQFILKHYPVASLVAE